MIEITAQAFIGIKFSNLCQVKYDENNQSYEVNFLYKDLEEKVKKSFDDNELHPSEITPELIALLFDLDYSPMQNSHDAYIGESIQEINLGTNNESICEIQKVTTMFRKIKNHIITYIGDDYKWMIKFVLIGKIHLPSENKEIEE